MTADEFAAHALTALARWGLNDIQEMEVKKLLIGAFDAGAASAQPQQ